MIGAERRLEGVDLLRGLAIFFVLMNHVSVRLAVARIPYALAIPKDLRGALVWNGQNGVQIFFAVSGFLITSMSLRRWGRLSNISLRGFYTLRFARIAPLLLLLLAVLSALHFTGSHWFVVTEQRGGLFRALVAALTFRVNVLEANRGYLPPNWDILWSLSVEEVFYIAFPIVCFLTRRERWLVTSLACFIVAGPFARTVLTHSELWRQYSYLGGMDAIALGCLTALALPQLTARAVLAIRFAGAALIFFILGFARAVHSMRLEQTGLDMTILAVGTCLVIVSVACEPTEAPAVLRPLGWMGRHSYEIYMTHMFVVIGLFTLKLRAMPFFALSVIGAGLFGQIVATVYSEPMNRRLRRRLLQSKIHTAVAG